MAINNLLCNYVPFRKCSLAQHHAGKIAPGDILLILTTQFLIITKHIASNCTTLPICDIFTSNLLFLAINIVHRTQCTKHQCTTTFTDSLYYRSFIAPSMMDTLLSMLCDESLTQCQPHNVTKDNRPMPFFAKLHFLFIVQVFSHHSLYQLNHAPK